MKKDKKKASEIVALNQKLYSDFSLEELEQRLETDPLIVGGVFGNDGELGDAAACDSIRCSHKAVPIPPIG